MLTHDPIPPTAKCRNCPARDTCPNVIHLLLHPPTTPDTLLVSISINSTDPKRVLTNPPYEPET